MTTSSKVKRYSLNQKDEETIFEISKDLIESSIATVCMNRHIFPRRIFHSISTQDRDLLKFRRGDSFLNHEKFENESQFSLSPLSWAGSLKTWVQEASSACHSTQIDPTVTEWQKVEIQLILDWLQNEACTYLKDYATTKIVFDIVRSLDDVILEEYEFTLSYHKERKRNVSITLTEEVQLFIDGKMPFLQQEDRYLSFRVENCNELHSDRDDCSFLNYTQMSTKMRNSPIANGKTNSVDSSANNLSKSPIVLEDSKKKRTSSRSKHGYEKPCKRNKNESGSTDETSSDAITSHDCDVILPNQSRVYAIPRLSKSDRRPKNIHLPCEIIGHRFQQGTLQYKLSFDDKILDQNRIRKQWRNATRIQTKSEIIDKILREIYSDDEVDLEDVARRMGVSVTLVQEVFDEIRRVDFSSDSGSGYQNDSSNRTLQSDIILSRDHMKLSRYQTKGQNEPHSLQKGVAYTFAALPVTVTIT